MQGVLRAAAAVAAVVAVALCGPSGLRSGGLTAATRQPDPLDVLRQVGLRPDEIAAVEGGAAVARALETDRRQIAVAGAVRIRARRETLAARFRTIDYLKGGKAVIDAGPFNIPPSSADLRSVPFEHYDLDVRDCRPGDCRVRLSDADIARFQREVRWGAPDWPLQSAAIWRDVLGSYAAAYWKTGADALPVYANKADRLPVAEEQALLLRESSYVATLAPGLLEHLRRPPSAPLPRTENLIYWSKEDFGVRPVLRITSQTIYAAAPSADVPDPPVVISSTQLYAAHYLDAAVGFVIALEAPREDAARGFYVVAVNRARTRSLSGFMRSMARSTVRSRSESSLEKILRSTKAALENGTGGFGAAGSDLDFLSAPGVRSQFSQ